MTPRTKFTLSHAASFARLRLYSRDHSNRKLWPALRRMLALVMALLLLPLSEGELLAQQAPPPPQYAQPQQDYSGQMQSDESGYPAQPVDAYPQPVNAQVVQPLDAVRLEQLVAPIALYPDSLVALTLTASTYPAQVVEADRWRQMQGYASPEQIAAGADAQNWDASVKGADRISPGAGADGPQSALDHRSGQCVLQPARRHPAGGAGDAATRASGRISGQHSAGCRELCFRKHPVGPGESTDHLRPGL